jgi:hypothetical protein
LFFFDRKINISLGDRALVVGLESKISQATKKNRNVLKSEKSISKKRFLLGKCLSHSCKTLGQANLGVRDIPSHTCNHTCNEWMHIGDFGRCGRFLR